MPCEPKLALVLLCWVGLLVAPPSAKADAQEALDDVDALFSDYFSWFGSMYDRHSGGAYYSSAARAQPHRYPPHIESTSKYARVIDWSGLVDQTPQAVRNGIVDYVKSRQVGDPDHDWYGFFLDRNYGELNPINEGESVQDNAAARALGFATGMLNLFGATPDHPLPSADANPGALAHLQSAEAFTEWLKNRNWNRTWTAGNHLLSQASNIKQLSEPKRTEILNAAWDYLETHQQSDANGLWGNQDQGSNTQPYILLNGAHKIVAFYAQFSQPLPHAQTVMDTMLDYVQDNTADNLLFVYNTSQLAHNLTTAYDVTISDDALVQFVSIQATYLARFRRADGGFSTTGDGQPAYTFQPATSGPTSNTDVGGLALKTRDRLHDLIHGDHHPLANADDPRLFGMSGANSNVLLAYRLSNKATGAEIATGLTLTGSSFIASATDRTGRKGNGRIEYDGSDDRSSYYEFTVTPGDEALDLYFLALTMRHSGGASNETVVVNYRVGNEGMFEEAGRTTIPGTFVTRDIPLLTFDELQGVKGSVTFRIHGLNFAREGRRFHIDEVELYGVAPGATVQ